MKPHERLDHAMNERRLDLDMKWNDLAEAAGIKPESLRAIRRGDHGPSDLTARRLDDALRWQRGSVKRILDDAGEPTPLPELRRELTTSEIVAEAHRDLDALEALEQELQWRMATARKSPKDLERAVTALRLIQGDPDDSGAN